MDLHEVFPTKAAERDLGELRPYTRRALREIAELAENPLKGSPKKGSLKGVRCLDFHLPGRGPHRVAYVIDKETRQIIVFLVGPRQHFYSKAERRYRTLRQRLAEEKST